MRNTSWRWYSLTALRSTADLGSNDQTACPEYAWQLPAQQGNTGWANEISVDIWNQIKYAQFPRPKKRRWDYLRNRINLCVRFAMASYRIRMNILGQPSKTFSSRAVPLQRRQMTPLRLLLSAP